MLKPQKKEDRYGCVDINIKMEFRARKHWKLPNKIFPTDKSYHFNYRIEQF